MHPEDVGRMKDIVIDEALQDMDKDKDGYVTVDEYISKLCVCESGKIYVMFYFQMICGQHGRERRVLMVVSPIGWLRRENSSSSTGTRTVTRD